MRYGPLMVVQGQGLIKRWFWRLATEFGRPVVQSGITWHHFWKPSRAESIDGGCFARTTEANNAGNGLRQVLQTIRCLKIFDWNTRDLITVDEECRISDLSVWVIRVFGCIIQGGIGWKLNEIVTFGEVIGGDRKILSLIINIEIQTY